MVDVTDESIARRRRYDRHARAPAHDRLAVDSAYSYVKLSNAFPSSGGVALFLREAYGPGTTTGTSETHEI